LHQKYQGLFIRDVIVTEDPCIGRRRPGAPSYNCGLWRLASHYWKTKEAWQQRLKKQTMLVIENRLNLADPRARKYLLEQTERYFFGEGADMASGYVPPTQ
jgi:hypothetical protein